MMTIAQGIFQGRRVKQQRNVLKLTLQQLANKVGTSKSYIWELENKRTDPGSYTLYRLSAALGVSMEWLCGVDVASDDRARNIGTKFINFLNTLKE